MSCLDPELQARIDSWAEQVVGDDPPPLNAEQRRAVRAVLSYGDEPAIADGRDAA